MRICAVATVMQALQLLCQARIAGKRPSPVTTDPATITRRASIADRMFTCGYFGGDPSKGWLAPSGYDCRVDTQHGLWGFCPTTVIAATDCGLGGYCFDTNTCTTGCGKLSNNPDITTWTCTPSDPQARYCSMAFLTFGVDQTYEYFHCGPEAATASLMAIPTAAITTQNAHRSSPTSAVATILPAPLTSTMPSSTFFPLSSPTLISTPGPFISVPSDQDPTASSLSPGLGNSSGQGNDDGDGGNNLGAIIGGTIGGLALLCVFGGVVVYLLVKARLAKTQLSDVNTNGVFKTQNAYIDKTDRRHGGWGPSELPTTGGSSARSPVELPTGMPSQPPTRSPFEVHIKSPVELSAGNKRR